MLSTTQLLVLLSAISSSDAFWRMRCHSRTGLARIDPLVDTGVASDHSHVIHGGGNFNFDTKPEDLAKSDCTSCAVSKDKSAYWTPPLYFVHSNGTTEIVPQVGGMIAYYETNHGGSDFYMDKKRGDKIKAFPKGFAMLAGDTRKRNYTDDADPETQLWRSQKAIGFNCLNPPANQPPYRDAEPTVYRNYLPDKGYLDANCTWGLRLELFFPSCWNGEDLDPQDHKSHVTYPAQINDGECPKGFGTRLPTLLYETIWDTPTFKGMDGQFVLGNGDPTGYGYHGDFMMGWDDEDFLQEAIDTCDFAPGTSGGNLEDCPLFKQYMQSDSESEKCNLDMPKVLHDDNCAGPRDGICGGVPIQSGPEYASKLRAGLSAQPTPKSSSRAPEMASTTATTSAPPLESLPGMTAPSFSSYGDITIQAANKDVVDSPATEAPPTTEAPPMPSDSAPRNAVSTRTFTSEGNIYEVVVEQVDLTVTSEVTITAEAQAAPSQDGWQSSQHGWKYHRRMHQHHRRAHGYDF